MKDNAGISGRTEFMIKEYELLFVRNEQAQQNRWRFIQFYSVAVSAFHFTLFNRDIGLSKSPSLDILIWLPVALAIFGGVLSWGLRIGMEQRGLVMAAIEEHFAVPGWESLRDSVRGKSTLPSPLTSINYIFWTIATFASAWIAVQTNIGVFLPVG